ncbi:MAG: metallophosphoesterase [Planctomycetota bacterium]|jgi:hypothetical protein
MAKRRAHGRDPSGAWLVTRRRFLKASGLAIAGSALFPPGAHAVEPSEVRFRFGIVTDAHYADTKPRGKRHYRESIAKMRECVARMNGEKVAFLVELGDFKDQAAPPGKRSTLAYLKTIERVYAEFAGPTYHVIGNHDVDSISKHDFLAAVVNSGVPRKSKYYSFDSKGLHFIVLDANYLEDGTDYDSGNFHWTKAYVPPDELKWLADDLAATKTPSVVFIHQQLAGKGPECVKNAPEVRQVLQKHGRVLAVFQGHKHSGGYDRAGGIHYYALKAMVEGSGAEQNAYAIAAVHGDFSMTVTGYRRAEGRKLAGDRSPAYQEFV